MKEEFEEVTTKLYDLYNTFSKARGEWNDGYSQGVIDSLGIVGEVKRSFSHKKENIDNLSHLDIEMFKKNYFKRGNGKWI